jgi:tRNA(Ser,Leu) C12 N-acetylase TAN1
MLAGKSFHVRLHRRGLKGTLSTPREERFLDETLLDALESLGAPSRITFTDPDAILQIETIDGRAGVSLWQREDLQRYPFLGVS